MGSKTPISMEHAVKLCPVCGEGSKVKRSDEQPDGSILRRRVCKRCGTQYETAEKFLRVVYIPGQGPKSVLS